MSFTKGEWKKAHRNNDDAMLTLHGVVIGDAFVDISTVNEIGDSHLIAAAGNAATRAEEMGYDGRAAVEALPELLEALDAAKEAISEAGGHHVYCKYRTAKEDGIMDKVPCNCWNGEAVGAIETTLTKAKAGKA